MIRNLYFLPLLLMSMGLRAQEPEAVIPFKIINEHMFIELSVNDSEPLNFVFDTGAAGNVMADQTAEKLEMKMNGNQVVQGASGATSIKTSNGHQVSVNEITIDDLDFMVMDLGHLSDEDATLDGIIGASILYRYVVEVDYDDLVMRLYKRKGFKPEEGWQKQRMSLRGFNIPIVKAKITLPDGETLEGPYLVDTGAATTVKFNTPFVNKNELIDKMGKHYAYTSRTLSKTATDEMSMLTSYEIFGHTFKAIPVRLSQGTKGVSALTQVDGILGLSILKRFNTIYDYYNQLMYLKPNQSYGDVFHVNHDGMKIEKREGGFEVTAVFEGSNAEKAGIQLGDLILKIDGRSDFTRHSFHHYFEAATRKVSINLKRGDQVLTIALQPESML